MPVATLLLFFIIACGNSNAPAKNPEQEREEYVNGLLESYFDIIAQQTKKPIPDNVKKILKVAAIGIEKDLNEKKYWVNLACERFDESLKQFLTDHNINDKALGTIKKLSEEKKSEFIRYLLLRLKTNNENPGVFIENIAQKLMQISFSDVSNVDDLNSKIDFFVTDFIKRNDFVFYEYANDGEKTYQYFTKSFIILINLIKDEEIKQYIDSLNLKG